MRKIGVILGGLVSLLGMIWCLTIFWPDTALARTITAYQQPIVSSTQMSMPEELMETAAQTTTIPITPELPKMTSTPTVLEPSYFLAKTVDLASGDPIALTINLPDGGVLQTNWAGTLPYKDTDDLDTVFAPDRGVVYSYLGDVTTTWAHSGINIYGQHFFATSLDLYWRKKTGDITVTMPEAIAKANSLKGMTAYLCQVNVGEAKLLSDYDLLSCTGKLLAMKVAAVAIVPREKVNDYDSAVLDKNQWLVNNFPGSGFEQLNASNGWLISFCVGKMSGQQSDGTPSYLYNRGVIGFKMIDGSS